MIKIKDRNLIIEGAERSIGVDGDNLIEIRQFEVTETSLFAFNFKLDTEKSNGEEGIIDLIKTTEDGRIMED